MITTSPSPNGAARRGAQPEAGSFGPRLHEMLQAARALRRCRGNDEVAQLDSSFWDLLELLIEIAQSMHPQSSGVARPERSDGRGAPGATGTSGATGGSSATGNSGATGTSGATGGLSASADRLGHGHTGGPAASATLADPETHISPPPTAHQPPSTSVPGEAKWDMARPGQTFDEWYQEAVAAEEEAKRAEEEREAEELAGPGLAPRTRTEKKTAAIAALLSGLTVTEAAREAGVNRRTIYRWLHDDPKFQAQLDRSRAEVFHAVEEHLTSLACQAADCLEEAIQNGSERAAIQLLKGLGLLSGPRPAGVRG